MRVRKMDASNDMTFGNAQGNFWKDVPDAPGQVVMTRLWMFLGEWFLDITDGTPWNTKVLGKYTGSTRDPVIQARILGTQAVKDIAAYGSQVDRDTRQFSVQANIDTIYGATTIAGPL